MNVAYHETTMDQILHVFAQGFKLPTGEKLAKFEVFTAPIPNSANQRVLFRLFIEGGEKKILTLEQRS